MSPDVPTNATRETSAEVQTSFAVTTITKKGNYDLFLCQELYLSYMTINNCTISKIQCHCYIADCCNILTMSSTGVTTELQPEVLGVYKRSGISNNRTYYKNEHPLFLNYVSTGSWYVTKEASFGENKGWMVSSCTKECPSSCKNWEAGNTTSLKFQKDPTFTISCAG